MSDEQLTRERDELRAEVERLKAEFAAAVDAQVRDIRAAAEREPAIRSEAQHLLAKLDQSETELAKLREERRWVPADTHPKTDDWYLVWADKRHGTEVTVDYWGAGRWWNLSVRAYMPLPTPPGEKGA